MNDGRIVFYNLKQVSFYLIMNGLAKNKQPKIDKAVDIKVVWIMKIYSNKMNDGHIVFYNLKQCLERYLEAKF